MTVSLSYAKLQLLAVSRPGHVSLRKQSADINVVNPKSAWKNSRRISLRRRGGKQVRDEFSTH